VVFIVSKYISVPKPMSTATGGVVGAPRDSIAPILQITEDPRRRCRRRGTSSCPRRVAAVHLQQLYKREGMSAYFALLALPLSLAQSPPVPNPARPAPFFSWDTLPRAFHGANRSGMFSAGGVAALANYSMVTIEKWYTPCGAQMPNQSGPDCAVEDKCVCARFCVFARGFPHTPTPAAHPAPSGCSSPLPASRR
jgi:hypothetical protein